MCVTVFQSKHWGSRIPSSWMVHAGCIFVSGILGHECRDLLSLVLECMYAQTRPRLMLSSERVLGEWSQSPC